VTLVILYPFSIRYVSKLDSWAHKIWAFGFSLKPGVITDKKDQGWPLLDRGSAPWRPMRTAAATPTAGKDSETYKTPNKWSIPVTTGTTVIPRGWGDTSARRGYDGGLVDGLVSVRGRFGRHPSMEIPACRLNMSPHDGRSIGSGEWGGGATSPALHLHPLLHRPLPRIQARREFPPLAPLQPHGWRSRPISFASVPTIICCRHGWPPASQNP
jgi:hypothetical protein